MNIDGYLNEVCMCPVCFICYDGQQGVPVVGACGHTLCQECSLALSSDDKSKFLCPTCGRDSEMPLSRNLGLINILEILQFDVLFAETANTTETPFYIHYSDILGAISETNVGLFDRCTFHELNLFPLLERSVLVAFDPLSKEHGIKEQEHREIETLKSTSEALISILTSFCHPNVALCVSYTIDPSLNIALVYDKFANHTIHDYLFPRDGKALKFNKIERLSFAIEITRGIIFLLRKLLKLIPGGNGNDDTKSGATLVIDAALSNVISVKKIGLDDAFTARILIPDLTLTFLYNDWLTSKGSQGSGESGGHKMEEVSVSQDTSGESGGHKMEEVSVSQDTSGGADVIESRECMMRVETCMNDKSPHDTETSNDSPPEKEDREKGQLQESSFSSTLASDVSQKYADFLRSYGILLLVLLFDIPEKAAITFVEEKVTSGDSLNAILNQVTENMTFSCREADNPSDRVADDTLGLRLLLTTHWDQCTFRTLMHLSLTCLLPDQNKPSMMTAKGNRMVHVLARLQQLKSERLVNQDSRNSRNTISPRRSSSADRSSSLPSRLTRQPPPPSHPTRTRHFTSATRSQSSSTTSTVPAQLPLTSLAAAAAAAVAPLSEESNRGVHMSVRGRTPQHAKVHYHPGYYHEVSYSKKNRFGGSIDVPAGWRCCGSTRRNHKGCLHMPVAEVKHHPGRWVGESKFDCCSGRMDSSSQIHGGCVSGPQPKPCRSEIGY